MKHAGVSHKLPQGDEPKGSGECIRRRPEPKKSEVRNKQERKRELKVKR